MISCVHEHSWKTFLFCSSIFLFSFTFCMTQKKQANESFKCLLGFRERYWIFVFCNRRKGTHLYTGVPVFDCVEQLRFLKTLYEQSPALHPALSLDMNMPSGDFAEIWDHVDYFSCHPYVTVDSNVAIKILMSSCTC